VRELSKNFRIGNGGGDAEAVRKLAQDALNEGITASDVLNRGLLAGMDIVGQPFKIGEMFIPEVIQSAKTMHVAMKILEPHFLEAEAKGAGVLVIGTVERDLHDIGKNLVAMMMEGAGFKVVDLGTDIKPQVFLNAVKEYKPDILGMSALLTTAMPNMKETIDILQEAGLRDKVKVMVGGAPVSQDFTDKIKADAYGPNAGVAIEKAKHLIGN